MNRRTFLLTPAALSAATQVSSTRPHAYPRLYFDAGAIERLRQRIKTDAKKRNQWSRLLGHADKLLTAEFVPESRAMAGEGQHGNYGEPSQQMSDMGITLGLAWQVTQHGRYSRKLIDAMLYYSTYERWGGVEFSRRQPPMHSELNTANFCRGFGIGYDSVHGRMNPAERDKAAESMMRLGILPIVDDWISDERRIHALDSMGHNWWSVCVSMAGVAALALLDDDERAAGWVEEIASGLELWEHYKGDVLQNKPANFDRLGAFYESVGYANYALSEYLRFLFALSNVRDSAKTPRNPLLAQVGNFFVHTLYPKCGSYETLAFGDSSSHQSAADALRLLSLLGYGSPAITWYLRRVDPDSDDPMVLLYDVPKQEPSLEGLLRSIAYTDIGWGILRSAWTDNATLLAVKSGFTWNHAHADAGSFVLYHAGQPLLIDSGTCAYARPEYREYYRESRAHSVVLFNGEGQPKWDLYRGNPIDGDLHSLLDAHDVRYIYADNTGPMARYFARNFRHWLWLDGVILVIDDLLAFEPGRLDWLLHHAGVAERTTDGVIIANGHARARLEMLWPADATLGEGEGLAEQAPDRKRKYLVFSAQPGTRDARFVAAIVPFTAKTESTPVIRLASGNQYLNVTIESEDQATDVYFNLAADGRRMHMNSNNSMDGWETDAYLLAVTGPKSAPRTPRAVSRYFVSSASYLRSGGTTLLDSLSKVEAIWRPQANLKIALCGQKIVELTLHSQARPNSVHVNRSRAQFDYFEKRQLVRLRATGSCPEGPKVGRNR